MLGRIYKLTPPYFRKKENLEVNCPAIWSCCAPSKLRPTGRVGSSDPGQQPSAPASAPRLPVSPRAAPWGTVSQPRVKDIHTRAGPSVRAARGAVWPCSPSLCCPAFPSRGDHTAWRWQPETDADHKPPPHLASSPFKTQAVRRARLKRAPQGKHVFGVPF